MGRASGSQQELKSMALQRLLMELSVQAMFVLAAVMHVMLRPLLIALLPSQIAVLYSLKMALPLPVRP